MKSKTDILWSFISIKDRELYSMDESKFKKFWSSFMSPRLNTVDRSEIISANQNGLEIRFYDSKRNIGMRFKLSGNQGEYYSPYFFSSACNGCAYWDFGPMSPAQFRDVQFERLALWYRQNKEKLEESGVHGLKTGIDKEFRGFDELANAYEDVYKRQHSKAINPEP